MSASSHQPRQRFKIWDHYFYSEQHHGCWKLLQFKEGSCSVAQCMPFKHTEICTTEPVFLLSWTVQDLLLYLTRLYYVQLQCVQHCHPSGNGRQKSRHRFLLKTTRTHAHFSNCLNHFLISMNQTANEMQFKNTRLQSVKWSPWKISPIAFVN